MILADKITELRKREAGRRKSWQKKVDVTRPVSIEMGKRPVDA